MRKENYEIPKGHVEPGESDSVAALRELREETGVISSVVIGPELSMIDYSFDHDGRQIKKNVRYFIASMEDSETADFGPLPRRTKELRWMTLLDLPRLPLVNEELRPIVARALAASAAS